MRAKRLIAGFSGLLLVAVPVLTLATLGNWRAEAAELPEELSLASQTVQVEQQNAEDLSGWQYTRRVPRSRTHSPFVPPPT